MDKMIQTTIGALVEAEPALNRLIALKLDAKTRYHAVKLARLVSAETKDHFYEPRQAVIVEMGLDKEPEVPRDRLPEFLSRIRDLTLVPVTLPWGPITGRMLENYPDFTGADMLALGPLCVLDEPEGA